MEGPRAPLESEFKEVVQFLDSQLRSKETWSIENEYPTALTPANLHNMRIIKEENRVLSHAVLKPLIIKSPLVVYKVAAIGSVVTEDQHRNQGLSRKIILDCLDEAKKQACDLAILWTDLYDFYRKMDFELAGQEVSATLPTPATAAAAGTSYKFITGTQIAPEAISRLFAKHSITSARTTEDIRRFMKIPQSKVYTAWGDQGQLEAYAIEGKGADLSGYIHEWGGQVSALMALFDFIQKERGSPITVIAPATAKNLISKLGSKAPLHHGYLGMIKILNEEALFTKIKKAARHLGLTQLVLERRGQDVVFGLGADLVLVGEPRAVVQILFGPFPEIDSFTAETKATLGKMFPLPLWIWGWDSV